MTAHRVRKVAPGGIAAVMAMRRPVGRPGAVSLVYLFAFNPLVKFGLKVVEGAEVVLSAAGFY